MRVVLERPLDRLRELVERRAVGAAGAGGGIGAGSTAGSGTGAGIGCGALARMIVGRSADGLIDAGDGFDGSGVGAIGAGAGRYVSSVGGGDGGSADERPAGGGAATGFAIGVAICGGLTVRAEPDRPRPNSQASGAGRSARMEPARWPPMVVRVSAAAATSSRLAWSRRATRIDRRHVPRRARPARPGPAVPRRSPRRRRRAGR